MPATPFTVKAIFEYTSDHEDDLAFSIGQIITVTAEEDEEWYYGEYTADNGTRKEGIFPRNFVEKYEPPAPPRPSRPNRPKKDAEPTIPVEAVPPPPPPASDPTPTSPESPTQHFDSSQETGSISPQAVRPPTADAPQPTAFQQAAPPLPSVAAVPKPEPKAPPPSVADKPTSTSFKDRIAAFNKAAAAPITPFNPAGTSSTTNAFIKKPFVAPPPSKNAFVPMPVEAPAQKVYKRDEDPEILEQNQERLADRSPPPPPSAASEDGQPKPTSLKERIALLQKQQLEQAARHADAAQKKEKPKKPPQKKHVEIQDPADHTDLMQGAGLEKAPTSETAKESKTSDDTHDVSTQHQHRTPVVPHMTSPLQPHHEITSDANDADYSGAGDTEEAEETSTSKEDIDVKPTKSSTSKLNAEEPHPRSQEMVNEEAVEKEEEEEEEEEEVDPEIKRRMELRDRMAKMSGGMGMMGMFGPPPGLPGTSAGGYKKPKPDVIARSQDEERLPATAHALPVPVMVIPGMQPRKQESFLSPTESKKDEPEANIPAATQAPKEEPADTTNAGRSVADNQPLLPRSTEHTAPPPSHPRPIPPPVPGDRPSESSPPPESRPAPILPARGLTSPSLGEESDDELSITPGNVQVESQSSDSCPTVLPTSIKEDSSIPSRPPTLSADKRSSQPPPVPHAPPLMPSAQVRPPPPPPPFPVSRKSTNDSPMSARTQTGLKGHDTEEEVTEYEGDYDTDIAPGATHKDALKSHGRDSSIDEGTITDEFNSQSPRTSHDIHPPLPPPNAAPRAAPPPPPAQPPKSVRQSVDMPRTAPPPIPTTKEHVLEDDDEYDPYRYDASLPPPPPPHSPPARAPKHPAGTVEDDFFPESPPRRSVHSPPLPPSQPPPQATSRTHSSRQSADLLRTQSNPRRSMDISRPSMESYFASDVDLGESSFWWTQPKTPPPIFQHKKDILYEVEESTSTNRGGKTTIAKDVYILFMDYSQTIVTVRFDSKNPGDVILEQRHEAPPARLRQDQLEASHTRFGARLAETAASKQNTTVGDGTPHALIKALVTPLSGALLPVGVRAYGAIVYSNLANASVQQYDEIRAGDVVTFRNARFQGHRGTMHQKYNIEVGKPDHAGIVLDWDGTKKKIRAWEQGRESKKVKIESFKLGDLKSGECLVWRVMPRGWVGWEEENKS
ncbi:assembly of actin patch protein [Ophidiomyces ophidiicola]|nr:assembly of actin patch protein [Ophidiomyces ophidiicola]